MVTLRFFQVHDSNDEKLSENHFHVINDVIIMDFISNNSLWSDKVLIEISYWFDHLVALESKIKILRFSTKNATKLESISIVTSNVER